MIKLNKHQCKWIDIFFGLTKKDMPYYVDATKLKNHLKGKSEFCYHDIYLSVKQNMEDVKNNRKIDLIGRQLSFMLAEALEDEEYEICKNLAYYFEKVNYQIDSLYNYYFNEIANKNNKYPLKLK
jgi:hypothetical protein